MLIINGGIIPVPLHISFLHHFSRPLRAALESLLTEEDLPDQNDPNRKHLLRRIAESVPTRYCVLVWQRLPRPRVYLPCS